MWSEVEGQLGRWAGGAEWSGFNVFIGRNEEVRREKNFISRQLFVLYVHM